MMPKTPQAFNGTAFCLTGPVDAPVVVFIHGLGLCRDVFADMLPAYVAYRVLTYDLYGHGASEPPPIKASLKVYADQLKGLMDHLGIPRAHIVGFSIGGMINRRFALDHRNKTASLIILNSPHDRGPEAQTMVEARAKSVREQGAFSTFDAALKRWFTPEYLASGTGAAKVRAWREAVDAESYAQATWVLANGVVELTGRDGEINAPTLVITCENDSGSTPEMGSNIAAEIAGAQTIIIPKLQHLGLMEQPDVYTKPIRYFLERQSQ